MVEQSRFRDISARTMADRSNPSGPLERALARAIRFATHRGDRINSLRRHAEMICDQAFALSHAKLLGKTGARTGTFPFDGEARFALITVNFSTTRYLKLMLLTLCQQEALHLIKQLIIVDNDSRDGGLPFLRRLASAVPRVHLLEQRSFPTHARGLRNGFAFLDSVETGLGEKERSNVLLPCDTDIIFRSRRVLSEVAALFEKSEAAFVGELRHGLYPYPEAQASFFAVRRDVYARRDVAPIVHHGAPAYFMQRSLWRANLNVCDFPSNHGGHILHRGRSGVFASRTYRPRDPHSTALLRDPHYMGVPGGELVWAETEARFASLLEEQNEAALLSHLSDQLIRLGSH